MRIKKKIVQEKYIYTFFKDALALMRFSNISMCVTQCIILR